MSEKFNNQQEIKGLSAQGDEGGSNTEKNCSHCDLDSCVTVEMQPMLHSILDIYGGMLDNKKVRDVLWRREVYSRARTRKGSTQAAPGLCQHSHQKARTWQEVHWICRVSIFYDQIIIGTKIEFIINNAISLL